MPFSYYLELLQIPRVSAIVLAFHHQSVKCAYHLWCMTIHHYLWEMRGGVWKLTKLTFKYSQIYNSSYCISPHVLHKSVLREMRGGVQKLTKLSFIYSQN